MRNFFDKGKASCAMAAVAAALAGCAAQAPRPEAPAAPAPAPPPLMAAADPSLALGIYTSRAGDAPDEPLLFTRPRDAATPPKPARIAAMKTQDKNKAAAADAASASAPKARERGQVYDGSSPPERAAAPLAQASAPIPAPVPAPATAASSAQARPAAASPQRAAAAAVVVCALGAAACGAQAAGSMAEAQAQAYFAAARLSAKGEVDGAPEVAVMAPASKSERLEVWRKTASGYELIASAPKAGCQDCSGPTNKPNPTKLWFASGALNVEYQGGGAGMGYWAWRSTWGWDDALGAERAIATQRIGSDSSGDARHTLVRFVDGSRQQWLRSDSGVRSSSCRAAIAKAPNFSELSLPALFDGTLEPECQSGTETGDPLAWSPAPGGGALDNLMRASKPKAK